MRIINFFDGAQSETTPTIGNIVASAIVNYADDAEYEASEAGSPVVGNIYYNTTLNLVRYYNGIIWISIVDESSTQQLENKTIDGSSTGNNTVLTTSENVEVTPAGNLSSDNNQDALEELQGDIDSHDSRLDALEADSSDYELTANKGQPNGYAPLDASSKVPAANLPSYVDDVLEYADLASLPVTGETGKIYVTLDTNKTYRWSGSSYIEISASVINYLDDLLDVDVPTPTDGQVLTWDSGTSKWVNETPSAGTLDDLTDVDTTTIPPVPGDSLVYNGSLWVPTSVGGGSSSIRNPNYLINGHMELWQRGTSQAITTATYLADRWLVRKNGGTTTVSRSADLPAFNLTESGVNYSSELVTTSVSGGGAGDYLLLEQPIEGYYTYNFLLGTFTHHFWIKLNQTATLSVAYRNDALTQSYVSTFTVNAANTWEFKSITIPAPASYSGFSFNNSVGLHAAICLGTGSTFSTSTLNAWQSGNFIGATGQTQLHTISGAEAKITLCKIESGSVATKFIPFDGNVFSDQRACFRYYLTNNYWTVATGWKGTAQNTLAYYGTGVTFPVLMRTTPSVVLTNQTNVQFNSGTGQTDITSAGYREVRTAIGSNNNAEYRSTFTSANAEF